MQDGGGGQTLCVPWLLSVKWSRHGIDKFLCIDT